MQPAVKEARTGFDSLPHNAAASVMHILITLGMEGWAVSSWYIERQHFWFNGYVSALLVQLHGKSNSDPH